MTTRWRWADRLAQVHRPDRVVLMALDHLGPDSAPLALEGLGHAIWSALDEPRTSDELVAAVRAAYPDVGLTTADAEEFLRDLAACQVVTAV